MAAPKAPKTPLAVGPRSRLPPEVLQGGQVAAAGPGDGGEVAAHVQDRGGHGQGLDVAVGLDVQTGLPPAVGP